ncbi:MAG: SRPBCC family protein [Solirubrobacterales bacterium]|nr:SRPBCC family protein [Solirubrobacterales bacterium]
MTFLPFRIGQGRRTPSSATRKRVIAARVEDVWKVIADPYQMPRWWPGVERMEGVQEDRFTQVFKSKRQRTVRADFRLLASEPPGGQYTSGHRTWEQELADTPFERVLVESITEVAVEPADGGGTLVTLAQRQKLRGYSKTGVWAMRSATAKRLDQALEGLSRIVG